MTRDEMDMLQRDAQRMGDALSGHVPCVCGAWGIQYPLPNGAGETWHTETFETERDALAAAARVMNGTAAEYVTVQERVSGLWCEPFATFTREAWEEYGREQAD